MEYVTKKDLAIVVKMTTEGIMTEMSHITDKTINIMDQMSIRTVETMSEMIDIINEQKRTINMLEKRINELENNVTELKEQYGRNNMLQIAINGISINVEKINFINIIEVDDEEKIYVAIHLAYGGVIKTITTNDEEFLHWDSLCDVCSVRGTKEQVVEDLKEEGFL